MAFRSNQLTLKGVLDMAFETDLNFRQAWSGETTLAFYNELTLGRRMNATWAGDASTAEKVFVQKPVYYNTVTKPARKAAWGPAGEPSAKRLTINLDKRYRSESALYVEDEVENAVTNYRQRGEQAAIAAMALTFEADIVSYMNSLTGGADYDNDDNGFAGQILEIDQVGSAAVGYDHDSGKPGGTAAQQATAAAWMDAFLTDARVRFQRNSVPIMGTDGLVIGGGVTSAWASFPIELFSYGLLAAVEAKGLSLELTEQALRDLSLGGTALAGHWRGFLDIFVSNALAKPASAAESWYAYAGTDQAVAAPLRPMRNYVRTPANAAAERYEFRHATTGGIQLANSRLLIRGKFNAI